MMDPRETLKLLRLTIRGVLAVMVDAISYSFLEAISIQFDRLVWFFILPNGECVENVMPHDALNLFIVRV